MLSNPSIRRRLIVDQEPVNVRYDFTLTVHLGAQLQMAYRAREALIM